MKAPSPPAWFLAALVAMQSLYVFVPGPTLLERPWRLLGIPVALAGIALHSWASRTFIRAGTTIDPEGKPATLVREGPYARTRNPMYLAGVPILAGSAILLGTATPLAILLLYPLAASRWIAREESRLRERFGDEWQAYAGGVRRWI